MEDDILLEFNNFGFQYNAQATPTLTDINLTLRRGERVLIAGPSGCGKSTLIHCINGLIPFSYKGEISGSLKIKGRETRDLSLFEISKTVGTVLQDSDAQFVGMTVAEDIAFALENDCVGEPGLHDRVKSVAAMVDIDGFLTHAPGELSGGQKQRVSVAGILVDDVDILIFDEPLANLDPATGKGAIELIDRMQEETGAAVIIVEHRLEDVLHKSVDRIVLMYEGAIRADMSADEILSGSLLKECGIREPLYITALKYAGVEIKPGIKPSSLKTIELKEEDKERVRTWYGNTAAKAEPEPKGELLRTDKLDFTYENGKVHALRGITLLINKGEMTAIVGTNGAGKSTFAKVICGFEKETGGTIYYKGKDIKDLSIKERAENIGYVMQNPNQMISKVFIYDEVALGLRNRGIDEGEVEARVEAALRICGLWRMRKWPVSALSYGQKKRVTIASILTLEPDMIILDEPTAGQDYRHYTEIMEFLKELNRTGITVLMVTHDMHLMLEYADRAIVFSHGSVIADDKCYNILTDREVISEASLKETSLYELALKCGIGDGSDFVKSFIQYERSEGRNDKPL
ncbi:MAG TPA: heme ABC transporter ATP-binding protein [Lachnospiraceae bacterium]|nr:heme ABC transporter ATP-binding protein [Lachnospiraceae bacterium]